MAKVREAKRRAAPDLDTLKKDFKADVKHEPGGKWTATIRGRKNMQRAVEAMEGRRRIDRERGDKVQSEYEREDVLRKDGRKISLLAKHIDMQKKTGIRPVGRNGGSATHFMGFDAPQYEKGPDWLWFLWDGGWLPVSLWRNGALSPQRDPDGNWWTERDEAWVLEDEAV